MSFKNKDLLAGDILLSSIGEAYLYLGFYEGHPRTFYKMPDKGHLYLYVGNAVQDIKGFSSGELTGFVESELVRLRTSIDGNACYTARYKCFESRIAHVDLSPFIEKIQHPWGLNRLSKETPQKSFECSEDFGKHHPLYGGRLVDLMSLPVGTKFYVSNGNWDGEIVEKEDGKYVRNEVQEFKVTEDNRYGYWLGMVELPNEKEPKEENEEAER